VLTDELLRRRGSPFPVERRSRLPLRFREPRPARVRAAGRVRRRTRERVAVTSASGRIHVCIGGAAGADRARSEPRGALRRGWPDFQLVDEPRRTGAFVIWGLEGLSSREADAKEPGEAPLRGRRASRRAHGQAGRGRRRPIGYPRVSYIPTGTRTRLRVFYGKPAFTLRAACVLQGDVLTRGDKHPTGLRSFVPRDRSRGVRAMSISRPALV